MFYGASFIIFSNGLDSASYFRKFLLYEGLSYSEFLTLDQKDYFIPYLSFVLSRITESKHILFAVFALLFSWIYVKTLWIFIEKYKENSNPNLLFFLFGIAVFVPIFYINGIRFYLGAWFYFYGAYHIIIHKKDKYFIYTIFATIIHFGFLPALGILIVFRILGKQNFIYWPLLLVSFILPSFYNANELANDYAELLSPSLQDRTLGYTHESYVESRIDSFSHAAWYVQWKYIGVLYYVYFALLSIIMSKKKYLIDKNSSRLFSFILLFLACVNFVMDIPSVGVRFRNIWFLFTFAFLFRIFSNKKSKRLELMPSLSLIPVLLYFIVDMRFGLETMNLFYLIGNPITLVFAESDISLYNIFF